MVIKDDVTGIEISLTYDNEGFPTVSIETNGSYHDKSYRPTVEVEVNGVVVYEMLDEDDMRWNN